MKELRCKKCNYSFKGASISPLCSNCGAKECIFEEENAQELLDNLN